VFEQLRQSLNELLDRATKPEDRRTVIARMKTTLVQATMGLDDLRNAHRMLEKKLDIERKELETVRRRRELAVGINDEETASIAARFEKQHAEKVTLLEEKLALQRRELELAEREVTEMKAEIRAAMAGVPGAASSAGGDTLDDPLEDITAAETQAELDALARARARADRDADAARRLDELKKKMGK
jgi:phage shock protein A